MSTGFTVTFQELLTEIQQTQKWTLWHKINPHTEILIKLHKLFYLKYIILFLI